MVLKNEIECAVITKIDYAQMWLNSIRSLFFWIGIALTLSATIITATIPEQSVHRELLKPFRIMPIILIFTGILAANLCFIKSILGKIYIKSFFKFIFNTGVCLGGGFFANSFLVEVFGYSLKPAEAPYSWFIIGLIGFFIGSLIMYFTTRKT